MLATALVLTVPKKGLLREDYRWGSDRKFVVAHFRPRRWFKHLETGYANLYCACNRCNDIKSDTWPTPEEEQLGFGWVDPCAPDVKGGNWIELSDGNIEPFHFISGTDGTLSAFQRKHAVRPAHGDQKLADRVSKCMNTRCVIRTETCMECTYQKPSERLRG